MKNNFICPHCRGHIKVGEHVIFSAKDENDNSGLLLLSPEIGNYTIAKHEDFEIKDGDKIGLFCPICHEKLIKRFSDTDLAHIIMVDENKEEHNIFFSGIVGEHSTFKVKEGKVEKFGKDAHKFIDFENLAGVK